MPTTGRSQPLSDMYHICVNNKSMFRAPNIRCALNLWQFAKSVPWYIGQITIQDANGIVLYSFNKYQ